MKIRIEQLHKVYSDGEIDVDPIEFEKWLNGKPFTIPLLSEYINSRTKPIVDFEGDIDVLEIESCDKDLYRCEDLFEAVENIQKNRNME